MKHVLPLLVLLPALAIAAADTPLPPGAAQERNESRARPAREEPAGKADGDEDEQQAAEEGGGKLSLTASQQQAVGIRIEAPLPLKGATTVEGYATVLDPAVLASDAGRLESTRAAASAASADAARQESLYKDEAQASLKSLQAARAQAVEAAAQAQAARASFRVQWGPLAALSDAQRAALLAKLEGSACLLRADLPGHRLGAPLGREALLDVDGVQVAARVLGPLPRVDAQSQSAGWLLEVERAPPGFGPGARAQVRLAAATAAGLLVPAAALVYAEQGTYVYRQVRGERPGTFEYQSVAVRPLTRVGEAWLVEGLGRADQVVVQGAGVLWSLQGISGFSAAEEEHD